MLTPHINHFKMSSGKQLVKGKSGLRMVAVSESERCPFLLEEPHWTEDAQVFFFLDISIPFLWMVLSTISSLEFYIMLQISVRLKYFFFAVSELCEV